MASAPKINFLDGSGVTQSLTITTNLLGLFFSGTVDTNTVDVQININGDGFISDPTLVGLELPVFRVPNLSSYPEGLLLDKGQNTIQLRSIDVFGAVSSVSTIVVTVVNDNEVGSTQSPPTGIRVIRHGSNVEINWVDPTGARSLSNVSVSDPDSPIGYNVYASVGPGGTISGYLRLNRDIIPSNTSTKTIVSEVPFFEESFDLSDSSGNDLNVFSETVDPANGEVIARKSFVTASLVYTQNFRLRTSVSDLNVEKVYSFVHDRTDGVQSGILNNDVFGSVSDSDPIFYVVTAVYANSSLGTTLESRFSAEISGAPLPLDTNVRGLRIRDRKQVTEDYINEVKRVQPTLALIPGSTIREIHIEPFANEIQKSYFLMDFVHRSKSFAGLLGIDDPGLTGTPRPFALSPYKQQLASALSLNSETAVQTLINGAFDSLAQNFGQTRDGLRSATVIQTFYTEVKPTRDLIVSQNAIVSSSTNSSAPRFRSRGLVRLTYLDAEKFYNPDLRRYEVQVEMVAETSGSVGNLPAGALDTNVTGATGFKTINTVASDFGRDTQSNLDLAESCIRAYTSVDTGTSGGYERIAAGCAGVFEAKVVKSGDKYMMRDYDPVRKKHIGGKVDIYVKGTQERTVVENFAFQFSLANNIRFDVIDPVNLIFRARDSRLTVSNPIQEMLFNPSQNLGLRNYSNLPVDSYDLTGVTIIDYRTIQLNISLPQPVTTFDDFVEGDYRYRSNNRFTANIQPIRRISSVVGEASGALDPSLGFTLFKTQDPLLEGESTKAEDFVTINQVGNLPNGQPIAVNDEEHVFIGQFLEPLHSVGINIFSIKVYSRDRSVLFNGPDSPNPDYLIVGGSQTKPVNLIRSSDSQIVSGSTISVDYEHDENFKVTYVVNDVLQQLQAKIETTRHVTGDALVKQALENPLSIQTTVQLAKNAVQSVTDDGIRTSLSVLTDGKGIGQSIHQSNIANKMSEVDGVDFIVQPFPRLTLQDGALRVRDELPSDYKVLASLGQFSNSVYILEQDLPFSTIDSGGTSTVHHGVYMDDIIMVMASSLETVSSAPNQSWIIGSKGAVIPGYSDDATLYPLFITADDVARERLARTANKVVISLDSSSSPADTPLSHSFSATYVVQSDSGAKDIEVSPIEYLTPGSLTITFRQALKMPLVRVNFDAYEAGEEYRLRLENEAQANFKTFMALLSSYWQSKVDGPNYVREIKAMSIALAQIRLALEEVRTDTFFPQTRGDFLYQTVTSVLFPNGAPETDLGDVDFRDLLLKIVKIYFQGSIPLSMKQAVELFTGPGTVIKEGFRESQKPGSDLDISDQFSFFFDIILESPGSVDTISADKNIRILLGLIRPAHTLYKLKYILRDEYTGQQDEEHTRKVTDSLSFALSNYGYEDFRKFTSGVYRVDPLGVKKSIDVVGEDHSGDF